MHGSVGLHAGRRRTTKRVRPHSRARVGCGFAQPASKDGRRKRTRPSGVFWPLIEHVAATEPPLVAQHKKKTQRSFVCETSRLHKYARVWCCENKMKRTWTHPSLSCGAAYRTLEIAVCFFPPLASRRTRSCLLREYETLIVSLPSGLGVSCPMTEPHGERRSRGGGEGGGQERAEERTSGKEARAREGETTREKISKESY